MCAVPVEEVEGMKPKTLSYISHSSIYLLYRISVTIGLHHAGIATMRMNSVKLLTLSEEGNIHEGFDTPSSYPAEEPS
jgi:hypothetical protein